MIFRLIKIIIVAICFMAMGVALSESYRKDPKVFPAKTKERIVEVEKIVEVVKEVPVYIYVEKGKYAVQIGSFLSEKFANKLKERLRTSYAISIKKERFQEKDYLVVFAEGFPSLKAAQIAQEDINVKEEVKSVIVKRF